MTKKVAVLGGGIAGLTAAYYLRKKGFGVHLYEKADVMGGLAHGFKEDHWEWPLERAYHHLFKNDTDIQSFAQEVGYDGIYFSTPHTDSLYKVGDNYRIFPVDSPQDFLRFPLLTLFQKLRGAAVLAGLKISPPLPLFESISAEKFVKKFMGERMWEVFFEQLFRKKFGKYAGKVLASFLWARISKRTKQLGYMQGGFQTFIDHVEQTLLKEGVLIHKGTDVSDMQGKNGDFVIDGETFDAVVSTLPSPILTKVATKVLSETYLADLQKLKYLHALVLILETDKPLLDNTYWLNICAEDIPLMFVGQHTNFVDPKHYGGNHLAYIGYYLERDDYRMNMSQDELVSFVEPYLKKISKNSYKVLHSYSFKGPFAQPIFDADFLKHKPEFTTPTKNFYVANLDMTYPYDRGTNYAVKLGKEVAALVQ